MQTTLLLLLLLLTEHNFTIFLITSLNGFFALTSKLKVQLTAELASRFFAFFSHRSFNLRRILLVQDLALGQLTFLAYLFVTSDGGCHGNSGLLTRVTRGLKPGVIGAAAAASGSVLWWRMPFLRSSSTVSQPLPPPPPPPSFKRFASILKHH